MKDFEAMCTIEHMNLRKEGQDNEINVVDLKVSATVDASVCDNLMCEDINDGDAIKAFWSQSEVGEPRFLNMSEVSFERAFENVTVNIPILGLEFTGSKLSKFKFTPKPGFRANLVFSASVRHVQQGAVEKMFEHMKIDDLSMKFSLAQGDMFSGQGQEGGAESGDDHE